MSFHKEYPVLTALCVPTDYTVYYVLRIEDKGLGTDWKVVDGRELGFVCFCNADEEDSYELKVNYGHLLFELYVYVLNVDCYLPIKGGYKLVKDAENKLKSCIR